jgi:hypothetical protein
MEYEEYYDEEGCINVIIVSLGIEPGGIVFPSKNNSYPVFIWYTAGHVEI